MNSTAKIIEPQFRTLEQACDWARTHYTGRALRTGETMLAHAEGMSEILRRLDVADELHISAYLFGYFLIESIDEKAAHEQLAQAWGKEQAERIHNLHSLMEMGARAWHHAQSHQARADDAKKADKSLVEQGFAEQIERSRKMLLAMADDIRVVILRLASRLQTLRYYAASKTQCPPMVAEETLQLYAPLANRLGVWQIKWELEDLGFRFAKPEIYRQIANWLDEKRTEREAFVADSIERLQNELKKLNIKADITGRPKHIYSIYNKMRGKSLQFTDLYDIRAFRIIVDEVKDCYGVLGVMHHLWQPIPKEFDDYIARPKPNGYQSLHTVVVGDDSRPMEVQIRTRAMHQFAEYGVAAHWRYKEGGFNKNHGKGERDDYDAQIAWVRQLISWQSDLTHNLSTQARTDKGASAVSTAAAIKLQDPSIYVLTPDAKIIELPQGATPIDFAYYVHTNIGHRCRGAKINGAIVPLNTPLQTGQTVQITVAKQGGPSRDWLRDDFCASARTKSKIRAWFNTQDTQSNVVNGRALFEKELQRLAKTAVKHDEIADALGFDKTDDLYVAFAKEILSGRELEAYFQRAADTYSSLAVVDERSFVRPTAPSNKEGSGKNGVLVVGLDDLMTQFAQCCKPAPPDEIAGFVTRGKGISIHRSGCENFIHLRSLHPERVLACAWSNANGLRYETDIAVTAQESVDTMRHITDALAREKIYVAGLRKHKTAVDGALCDYVFNLEVESTAQLDKARQILLQLDGISRVERL